MKTRLTLLVAVVALSACVRMPAPSPAPGELVPPTSTPTAARNPFTFPDRVVITSSSLSLTVDDPPAAMAMLEGLVTEAGGFVSSSSSWSDGQSGYSNLSAEVPPEALAELRAAAIGLAQRVYNNSMYSQDVTSEVEDLQERLRLIEDSEERLLDIMLGSTDPALAKSFVLIAELFQQERRNARSQLESYQEQAGLASFDVSLNRPPVLLEFDMGPTPTPLPLR